MEASPKLALRVKSKKSQNAVLRDVDVKDTVQSLLEKLSNLTGIPQEQIALLKGFPPKRINFKRDDTVESLQLQHQDTIIVELDCTGGESGEMSNQQPQSSSGSDGNEASTNETTDVNRAASSNSANGHQTETARANDQNDLSYADLIPSDNSDDGLLLRQVVPADNSCLFSSVTYCLSGHLQTDSEGGSSFLREMIANTVEANPTKYNEAILGRPNKDYVNWIKKSDSWGGGIELSILAEFYGMQISVVDTQSLHISCFGEDHNYTQRIFIIYDGIHYDPLYFEPFSGGPTVAIFETSNSKMMDLAKQLAQEAKASSQFTDLKNFSLRCQICNTLLKGEEEAQAHAKKTAHTSFAEIKK